MTCLYCGKKLGFFSRYKDTPFCSEEHLRSHQDELERALMERLGSKSTAAPGAKAPVEQREETIQVQTTPPPPRPLPAPPMEAPVAVQKLDTPKADKRPAERPVEKPVERPVEAKPAERKQEARREKQPVPEAPERNSDPAPLYEGYFEQKPAPIAAIDVRQPMTAPSSFAIIVQADCCTPISPERDFNFEPFMADEEFSADPASFAQFGGQTLVEAVVKLIPAEAAGFGDPWVQFPETGTIDAAIEETDDWEMEEEGDLLPLDFDLSTFLPNGGMLGHREEIPVRPRNRFPYAGSVVTTFAHNLPEAEPSEYLEHADDLDPVLPLTQAVEQRLAHHVEAPDVKPIYAVPLSIAALLSMTLEDAPPQDPEESLTVFARALSADAGLKNEVSATVWMPNTVLPQGNTPWDQGTRWAQTGSIRRVAPVPFPSLFQLGPVLPPRPEVHH